MRHKSPNPGVSPPHTSTFLVCPHCSPYNIYKALWILPPSLDFTHSPLFLLPPSSSQSSASPYWLTQFAPRWSLCFSGNDPFTTQWPEQASQNAHFSLCPLNVDVLVISHSSQNENVNMVRRPIWTHVMQPLLALPTPLCPVLTSLPPRLSQLQALIRVLPSSRSNRYPPGQVLSSQAASLWKFPRFFPSPHSEATFPVSFTLCPESLCLCSCDCSRFSSPCDYFFDFCLSCQTFSSRG